MHTPIQALHSHRIQLIPAGMDAGDVEAAAAARLLPEVCLKAPNCTFAAKAAHTVMGLPVHGVERIETADEAVTA